MSQEVIDDEIVSLFHKHIVYISFSFKKLDAKPLKGIITSLVMSVRDRWFLVTAGHCIRDISSIIAAGYRISSSYLIDSFGLEAIDENPIPFSYQKTNPVQFNEDDNLNIDYGIIPLSSYYCELLEKNGIQPLNEETWRLQPLDPDFYYLIGAPDETVTFSDRAIELSPIIFIVKKLKEKPDECPDSKFQLFYGKIGLGTEISSIKGMSGGPILAFKESKKGELRYWLSALLSHWYPNSHTIVGCPTKLLGDFLETIANN